MKRKLIVAVPIALAAVFAAFYLWVPGSAPHGQQPLATLSSAGAGAFEAAFDADPRVPRLVLLLSPT
ncbi:MAG TPA: hypothetical protein VGS20_08565 [Candidatus Acidoferrales bacterium]|nr:hypothetical protein [Candidatus Acidoferrales bacterium]